MNQLAKFYAVCHRLAVRNPEADRETIERAAGDALLAQKTKHQRHTFSLAPLAAEDDPTVQVHGSLKL